MKKKHIPTTKISSKNRGVLLGVSMLFCLLILNLSNLMAQCALCTKTAQQLGDGPAAGLNKGILYLMVIPLGILSIIGIKWYKKEKVTRTMEDGEQ